MKNLLISALALSFAFTSCKKEIYHPFSTESAVATSRNIRIPGGDKAERVIIEAERPTLMSTTNPPSSKVIKSRDDVSRGIIGNIR